MGVDLQQTLALAEEFRAAIAALEMAFEGTPLHMTASFGVVSAIPRPLLTAQEYLAAADRALYEAKGAGRNCVRAATLG